MSNVGLTELWIMNNMVMGGGHCASSLREENEWGRPSPSSPPRQPPPLPTPSLGGPGKFGWHPA